MSGLPMLGVDAPSSLRPWTPDERTKRGGTRVHVKRCCNGCGATIGDITDAELEAAIEGRRLPDVTGECPVCTPWTGTRELEPAWAPVLHFNHRFHRVPAFPDVRYRVPRDTRDPRWEACRVHHPACDCREAEINEQLREYRHDAGQRQVLVERLRAIARMHAPTRERRMCPVCIEQGPCSTRALAVEALRSVGSWWDDDE